MSALLFSLGNTYDALDFYVNPKEKMVKDPIVAKNNFTQTLFLVHFLHFLLRVLISSVGPVSVLFHSCMKSSEIICLGKDSFRAGFKIRNFEKKRGKNSGFLGSSAIGYQS